MATNPRMNEPVEFLIQLTEDAGMHDGIQGCQALRIGEDDARQTRTVNVSVRGDNLGTELTAYFIVSGLPGQHRSVGNLIGTDYVATKFAHHGCNRALAAADSTGQADAEHHLLEAGRTAAMPAVWPRLSRAALIVLLISMAMVSGPTPPGTGVMAPAICIASG